MIDALYTILTDANTREGKDLEAHLSENTSAGTAWFD